MVGTGLHLCAIRAYPVPHLIMFAESLCEMDGNDA